jgi:molecular chaperone GrpE
VGEHVVIRDKRKIDPSGRPRNPDAGDTTSSATSSATAPATALDNPAEDARPEVAMGQPGETVQEATESGSTQDRSGAPASGPKEADIVDAQEVVAGEVVPNTETAGFGAELESLRSELDERVRDLQRVTAEYANYRKRVDRDRAAVAEQAIGMVATALLPILDDLDRAREHDDLVGPSAAMAEQLSAALAKFGLTAFGEPGDAFDPTRHEAVAHQTSAEVTEPSCVAVMRRGYLLGDRLLRAALVAVADPE